MNIFLSLQSKMISQMTTGLPSLQLHWQMCHDDKRREYIGKWNLVMLTNVFTSLKITFYMGKTDVRGACHHILQDLEEV